MTSTAFPTSVGLAILMGVSLLTIGAAVIAIYVLLVRVELQSKLSFADATRDDDVALEESKSAEDNFANNNGKTNAENTSNGESPPQAETVGRRLHLPMIRRAVLAGIVAIITFMTYLFLTKSNANIVLSWIGMLVVLAILLRPTIFEEVRRDRLDRLAAILSLILVLAMALNLAVYANRQHAQGDIYQGKARIVGYDTSSYTQDMEKDTVFRTDLEVAWGGWWGCPNSPDLACEAFVAGALCESEEKGNRHRRRHLINMPRKVASRSRSLDENWRTYNRHDAESSNDSQEEKQGEGDVDQQEGAEVEGQDDQSDQDIEEKNEELEKENEELEKENQDLEQENEELQEELDEYKSYEEEEEDEIEELIDGYTFHDDSFVDTYWGETSWDSLWGEYACEDLFVTDMEGQTFDENNPPGSDEWPFVNIYGNCNTCEAYIVDFYSTEHFQSILSYKRAGLNYGLLAGISTVITGFLMFRHKTSASTNTIADKEIELLPTPADGAMA